MIQELFGGGKSPTTPLVKDINIISSIPFPSQFSSPSPYPLNSSIQHSTTTTNNNNNNPTTPVTTTATLTNHSNSSSVTNNNNNNNNNNNSDTNSQKLRCPRCDSTNTKFCYYNNYNLTQPRHFCKTCRRYWTKGGTLRNVPIGGGCRKNKTFSSTVASNSTSSASAASGFSKSSFNALVRAATKSPLSTDLLFPGNPGLLGNGLLDPQTELQSSPCPTFWPSLPNPQSSHILALFREANPNNPNPNPNPNSTLGFDPYGAPSLLGSIQKSNPHQIINGFGLPGPNHMVHQNGSSNILELYQRLKSSNDYTYSGNENPGTVILGNVVGSSSSSSGMYINSTTPTREGPIGDHGMGGYGGNMMMSSAIPSWSEFSTVPINGAFP